ncbi:NAD(P)H dehydrogenase [Chryseobacterium phosphatilyticum]|uniref:NAD(P)H dehydrogenase n=1 Tax=Chryseobacterium phosphatilyticum TaxID=475075 RepID=A0A316X9T4_9FLAO|nr:NAD(P)H-dependent oxidoreductase [Chryseobacterium phosphatilyticum]PWN70304.1 NAD(P)H dehydrogenase [Chryseobacterium phosphatilyticum]
MKHLIIYVHPNENSLNNNLLQHVTEILKTENHEVRIRDLYALNFDPILSMQDMQGWHAGQVSDDVKTEQEHISWAEQITFIYPIWWTGLPAVMKGYIDRVFSYGFAYRYDLGIQKGLLKGKKAVIINTHGKSHEEYQQSGMDKALSLTSDLGIFTYSGLEIIRHFFFDKADKASSENMAQWKEQITNTYQPVTLNVK